MKAECERHQLALLDDAPTTDHVRLCEDCRTFFATERRLAPPVDLVAATLERLQPALVARAANRRQIFWGLTFVGALSFPIIAVVNAVLVWMTYTALAQLATAEIAAAGASLVAASLLLALSIAYGSLPLLASWGVQLRERTT
jgi:hypothetical protein